MRCATFAKERSFACALGLVCTVDTGRNGMSYSGKLLQLGPGITYCDLRKPRADRKEELRLKPLLRTRCATSRVA